MLRVLIPSIALLCVFSGTAAKAGTVADRVKLCLRSTMESFVARTDEENKIKSTLQCYQADHCGDNSFLLLRELSGKKPFDITKAKVLYIFRKQPKNARIVMTKIKGSRAKHGPKEWNFHVVIEYRGLILDPDYTKTPRPVGRKTYFRKMFLRDPIRAKDEQTLESEMKHIHVRQVPGVDYLDEFHGPGVRKGYYDPSTSPAYYLSPDAQKRYPEMTLGKYLNPQHQPQGQPQGQH